MAGRLYTPATLLQSLEDRLNPKMSTKSDEITAEQYWRDDDFYIADDDGMPRRISREDIEDFARRRALLIAGLIVFIFAFAVRAGFNLWLGDYQITPEMRDMYEYDQVARAVLDGKGYARPWAFTDDRGETVVELRPTMFRPPGYTLTLTFTYAMTNGNPLTARILLSTVGAATCLLVFLIGRRVFSHKVGFLAGLLGAIYPFMWIPDGMLLPESLYSVLVMYLIFRLYLLRESVSAKNLILTGLSAGLIALTRTEGMIFMALVAGFIWLSCTDWGLRRRVWTSSVVIAITLAIYSPWAWHTWSTFGTLAPSSTVGTMLAGTTNRVAFYDQVYIGSWYYGGLHSDRDTLYRIRDPRENEKTVDDFYASVAFEYLKSHLDQVPAVIGVRELRAWDFWDPYVTARVEQEWGRPMWSTYAGLIFYYPALALALYGGWRFRRNWRDLFPFYFVAGFFVIFSALTFGTVRYRTWIEPTIVLFSTATLYGLARGGLLERSAPLRELLQRIETSDELPEPEAEIPDRMERALRMREARARLSGERGTVERALLPEGEEFEVEIDEDDDVQFPKTDYENYERSVIDEDGTIRINIKKTELSDDST